MKHSLSLTPRLFAAAALAASLGLAACAPMRTATGWQPLFDGNSLNGWKRVGDGNWRVEGGAIVADAKTGPANGFLVTPQSYKDFEIRAEFWSSPDANSGIFIRCADPKEITTANAYEVNIFDTRPDPTYGTGAIVGVAKVARPHKTGGRWNVMEIKALGDRFTVAVNGRRTADVQDGRHARGRISLQYGGGVVKFRKVQVRVI